MTRPRRRRAAPRKPRRLALSRNLWLGLALVVAIGLGVAWWMRPRGTPSPPPAPDGPWANLSPLAAFETGAELLRQGENAKSLPYLRHAYTLTRGELWEAPHAIFTALMNLSFETRELHRTIVPATRSSAERVQLVQEALYYLTQAERVATTPRDLATLRKARADALLIWGFGWEAFVNYRDAQTVDPTWDRPGLIADTLMSQLEHPTPSSRSPRLPPPGGPR